MTLGVVPVVMTGCKGRTEIAVFKSLTLPNAPTIRGGVIVATDTTVRSYRRETSTGREIFARNGMKMFKH